MRLLLTLLVALVAVTGCGNGEPTAEEKVRSTLRTFATAVEERDYQTLCDKVFAPDLLEGLQQIGLPCEIAMKTSFAEVREPKLTVGTVAIKESTATAQIKTSAAGQPPSSDVITLKRLGESWKVSALGADPAAKAKPTRDP